MERRWLVAAALLSGAVLGLAACSDGGEPAVTEASTTSAAPVGVRSSTVPSKPPSTAVPSTTPPTTTVTTTTTTSPPALGTLENPVALGSLGLVGEWMISVESVTEDANEVVANENSFNDPPAAGNQFFIAEVTATYIGDESGILWLDIDNKVVGDSNVAYEGFDAYCGVIPDDPSDTGEVFPGGTVTANLCWSVAESDVESLILILEPSFSFDDEEREFFALAAGGSATGLTLPVIEKPASGGAAGSRGNPIPLGSSGQVGDWMLRVVGVIANADDAVAEANQFNDPPDAGYQLYIVELEATYVGAESSHAARDLRFRVVGSGHVAYDTFAAYCGVIPDPLADAGETFTDGTVSGNECWSVASAEASSLILLVEDQSIFDGSSRVFFDLG